MPYLDVIGHICNMKNFLYLILALTHGTTITLAQSKPEQPVSTTSDSIQTFDQYGPELYTKIIPNKDKDYVYFEVRGDRGYELSELIISIGTKPKRVKIPKRETNQFGFFNCEDVLCSTYIIAVTANKTVELINTEELLIEFLGSIDNKEEAYLLNLANDFIQNGRYK
ncbi:hypothetical protein HZR84_09905 [Hyphobacterium sp. CCMP332]|nr:hypothetical protein HZR84_09905 [Hyphobacterium sp. CCMP332]